MPIEQRRDTGRLAPQILVISLRCATPRRRLMSAQLAAPDMPPHRFIDAVDGRRLSPNEVTTLYDEVAAQRHAKRTLTPGEIGCASSHLAAYRDIVAEGIKVCLMLEDDALLGVRFIQGLKDALARIDPDAPQALLLSHVVRYSAWGGERIGKYHFVYKPYEAYGAHAYLISLAGAKAMLQAFPRVETVADDWGYFAKRAELRVSALVPYLVGTSPMARTSQIGNDRFQRPRAPLKNWVQKYLWQRLLFQLVVKPALRLHKAEQTW